MSETKFHKICYTSRSTGYKYRTLSTNTGKRKRRDSKDESTFERKFREIQQEITSRIADEMDQNQEARNHINEKFEKVENKIDSMIELKHVMEGLRQDLHAAETQLADLFIRVQKLDTASEEQYSLNSRKSVYLSKPLMMDIIEDNNSLVSHV